MRLWQKGGVIMLCLLFSLSLFGGEYDFDLSEIEKKPYSFNGSAEIKADSYVFNRQSSLYNLKYREKPDNYDYSADLRLNALYEADSFKYAVKTSAIYAKTPDEDAEPELTFLEQYAGYKNDNFRLNAGKMAVKWGKGYAYNPAAFLDRPKNIDSPEDAMEGYRLVTAEYTRSLSGALKNFSYVQALYYVSDDMNRTLGKNDGINYAGKLYGLLWDTDVDFMYASGESAGNKYGFDFSKNILTNFEIHGEYGRYQDATRMTMKGSETVDTDNWLLGVRYLTENEITFIIEYFHKSGGYTEDEMDSFYLAAGETLSPDALLASPYSKNNPMTDYIYFRASAKEPFDLLYFSPAATVVANVKDGSFSFAPEGVYTGITNLELKLKVFLLSGGKSTEFGEKTMKSRIEASAKYYF